MPVQVCETLAAMSTLVKPPAMRLIIEVQDLSVQDHRRRREQAEIEQCVEDVQGIFV
jgi:hypothetical protein